MIALTQSEIIAALASASTHAEIVRILAQISNYCECGSDDTLALLEEMLGILNERKPDDGVAEYRQITDKVEALIMQCGRAGYGCWFVYTMECLS
jgi:hypothetical protein